MRAPCLSFDKIARYRNTMAALILTSIFLGAVYCGLWSALLASKPTTFLKGVVFVTIGGVLVYAMTHTEGGGAYSGAFVILFLLLPFPVAAVLVGTGVILGSGVAVFPANSTARKLALLIAVTLPILVAGGSIAYFKGAAPFHASMVTQTQRS